MCSNLKNILSKIILFIIFWAVYSPINVNAQYNTDEKRRDFYLEISKKYCPDAYEILQSEVDYKRFVEYANSAETSKGLLDNFGTVVHETCHGYNFKIGGWKYQGYFITKGVKILAKQGSFFPSKLLNKVIPKDRQEKIFRYDTYVGGDGGNSSNLQGIYGFLDEFSAYYHGTKADMELLKYYETVCPYKNAKCWADEYLVQIQSTLYAYYEFRLFIAWYLLYAQENEKKAYSDFTTNQNLRLAYTLLDDLFKKLVEDYFKIRGEIVKKLNEAGNEIEVGEEFIYIKEGNSKSGNGVPDEDIKYLKSLYTNKENEMLEKFRVKAANLSNYKQFLTEIKD